MQKTNRQTAEKQKCRQTDCTRTSCSEGWKGIVLAHSCQLLIRAVHKEIYKEMPWQSSFRGQLKLQSHPPWFPLRIDFNFPTSIPFIWAFPPGQQTYRQWTCRHAYSWQTDKQAERKDLQICRPLSEEKQTIRQQKSRDTGSRQTDSRHTGSREADKRTTDRGQADKEKQICFPAVCRLHVYSCRESDVQTIAYRRKQTRKRAVMDVATDRSL